jgi:hypothetical protein
MKRVSTYLFTFKTLQVTTCLKRIKKHFFSPSYECVLSFQFICTSYLSSHRFSRFQQRLIFTECVSPLQLVNIFPLSSHRFSRFQLLKAMSYVRTHTHNNTESMRSEGQGPPCFSMIITLLLAAISCTYERICIHNNTQGMLHMLLHHSHIVHVQAFVPACIRKHAHA